MNLYVESGTIWKSKDKRETRYVRVFSFDPLSGRVRYHRHDPVSNITDKRRSPSSDVVRFLKSFTAVSP